MKKTTGFIVVAPGFLASVSVRAQPTKPLPPTPTPTIASVMEAQMNIIESQFVPAAEAMLEGRYSFTPENGEYKGVRTFAQGSPRWTSENRPLGDTAKPAISAGGRDQ